MNIEFQTIRELFFGQGGGGEKKARFYANLSYFLKTKLVMEGNDMNIFR